MKILLKSFILTSLIVIFSGCEWVKKKDIPSNKLASGTAIIKNRIINLDSNIWISHFENLSDSAIYIDTTWYFYDDAPAKGESKLRNYSFYESLKNEKNNHYLTVQFKLKKAANPNYPFTGIGVNLKPNTHLAPEKIKGIIYDYKGYNHYLIVKQSDVKDYANYQSFLSESTTWKRDTILFTQLIQPSWGKKVEFDFSKAIGIDWFFTGSDQESGSLKIDNIRYLIQ